MNFTRLSARRLATGLSPFALSSSKGSSDRFDKLSANGEKHNDNGAFRCAAIASIVLIASTPLSAADRAPEFLNSPEAAQRGLPFSEAVRAGDFLFLAGKLGDDPKTGRVVPGGIKPEARQTLQHIKSVLERNGSSLKDVVKCTVFLADIKEWPAFNEVYREFFSAPFPARSALAASGLALDARVEVECIAYVPAKSNR